VRAKQHVGRCQLYLCLRRYQYDQTGSLIGVLTEHISSFISDGFLRIDRAFTPETAEAARRILWRDSGCDPADPRTWTEPVIRLGDYRDPPFVEAANTAVLRAAYDQLVGKNRWRPRTSLGTFVVRFPSLADPDDIGWHIDASFRGEATAPDDFLSWRVNVASRGRALLMLFLFSDVEEHDAPTRIRVGSHLDIARVLAPMGEAGLSIRELAINHFAESAHRPQIAATGAAGTVYLCHPLLVHAGQPHRGRQPRFLAQPPLYPVGPLSLLRGDGDYSPVEQAIRVALSFSY
jgi:Phytanoyl-CoA dioxygenase (PhyH)